VLTELVGDKSLERFRQEYEKLHRALKKSHESEKRLIKKCRELNAEIVSNAAKVQTALKLSQEDQTTIASLKREIEKAWKMVDASHEKEARAKETITQLKTEIANLSRLVEQGAGLSMGQENTLNELMREKEELTSERDAQVRLPTSHCILPCNLCHLPTGTGTTVAKHRRHCQHGRHRSFAIVTAGLSPLAASDAFCPVARIRVFPHRRWARSLVFAPKLACTLRISEAGRRRRPMRSPRFRCVPTQRTPPRPLRLGRASHGRAAYGRLCCNAGTQGGHVDAQGGAGARTVRSARRMNACCP